MDQIIYGGAEIHNKKVRGGAKQTRMISSFGAFLLATATGPDGIHWRKKIKNIFFLISLVMSVLTLLTLLPSVTKKRRRKRIPIKRRQTTMTSVVVMMLVVVNPPTIIMTHSIYYST